MTSPEICQVDGCAAAARSRGWCLKHYQRWYKYGDPTKTKRLRTYYTADPADSDLVEEIKATCDVMADQAERLAGYFELRLGGLDAFGASSQLDVSNVTGKRYELWFKHFMANRKALA